MIYNSNTKLWQRETWLEWLRCELPAGITRPLFYLPVRRLINMDKIVFWILPLAVPALIYYMVKNILMNIWYDCLEFSDLAYREWRVKRLERKAKQTDRLMTGRDLI